MSKLMVFNTDACDNSDYRECILLQPWSKAYAPLARPRGFLGEQLVPAGHGRLRDSEQLQYKQAGTYVAFSKRSTLGNAEAEIVVDYAKPMSEVVPVLP
ncbi:hypothetical protein PGT21_002579 [Puccinia graminis f. sp. tritici]|uniref:Uncharacterized protein n=1 Tax=Puccinia graminis f. sp. tritici TaxID=56615 RepID=A0A5B0M4L7_PUCGR|nr:hypothetical protein PGT21_002579 [Puccinia graminis f. sp. tritici]